MNASRWTNITEFRGIACRRSSDTFSTGPSERRSYVLPVGLLNRVLLKKVVIAVLVAAAEVVILSAGKRKR
jgi:hypothetical protein